MFSVAGERTLNVEVKIILLIDSRPGLEPGLTIYYALLLFGVTENVRL